MLPRMRAIVVAVSVAAMSIHSGAGVASAAKAAAARPVPKEDRRALEHTLATVYESLPRPDKSFRLDKGNGSTEIAYATTTWAKATKAPAEASAVRVYEKRSGSGEDAEATALEVRVYINKERSLPEPLGSEGGTLEAFMQDGIPCMRASLAGVTPGRVALPLTTEQEANALTVLRAIVGADSIEPYLLDVAKGRTPEFTPWDAQPATRPSDVRTIIVEYYGPRGEVERLLKATPAASLRALLTP